MANLTKDQLIQILEWANLELAKINKQEEKNQPIRGKKTVAYYCPSNKQSTKKWKVEFMGNHARWCETEQEVNNFINFIESN
jgi:hypothetical protein